MLHFHMTNLLCFNISANAYVPGGSSNMYGMVFRFGYSGEGKVLICSFPCQWYFSSHLVLLISMKFLIEWQLPHQNLLSSTFPRYALLGFIFSPKLCSISYPVGCFKCIFWNFMPVQVWALWCEIWEDREGTNLLNFKSSLCSIQ